MEQGEFVIGGRKSLPRVALVFNEAYDLLGMVRRRDNLRGLERIHDKSHADGDEDLCPLITSVFKGFKVSSEVKQIPEIFERSVKKP